MPVGGGGNSGNGIFASDYEAGVRSKKLRRKEAGKQNLWRLTNNKSVIVNNTWMKLSMRYNPIITRARMCRRFLNNNSLQHERNVYDRNAHKNIWPEYNPREVCEIFSLYKKSSRAKTWNTF